MKDKIREQLQSKYAGAWKKLTPKAQELLVDKISAKVTTDEELENALSGLESSPIPFADYVELIQSEADRRVSEAVNKAKEKQEPSQQGQQNQPNTQQQEPAKMTEEEKIAAAVAKALAPFAQQLQGFQTQTLQEKFVAQAKAKGIPETLASKVTIGQDFNADEALTTLESEWTGLRQLAVNAQAGDGRVPQGQGGAGKEASKEEVEALVNDIM